MKMKKNNKSECRYDIIIKLKEKVIKKTVGVL